MLDNEEIPITSNLHDALQRIRADFHSTPIWVDAICINQSSILEKNNQIPLMRDIFRGAATVLAWLGNSTALTPTVVKCLTVIADASSTDQNDPLFTTWQEFAEAAGASDIDLQCSLSSFYSFEWFRRCWVVQEVTVATNDPLFLLGPYTLPATLLHKSTNRLGYFLQQPQLHVNGDCKDHLHVSDVQPAADIFQLRNRRWSTMTMLLEVTMACKATLQQDKIYSLLGLTQPGFASLIEVDYNKSSPDLYEELTVAIIKWTKKLACLTAARQHGVWYFKPINNEIGVLLLEKHSRSVSWVPDWSNPADGYDDILRFWWGPEMVYQAALSVPAEVEFLPGSIMSAAGIFVDSIATASKTQMHSLLPGFVPQGSSRFQGILATFAQAAKPCSMFCSRAKIPTIPTHKCPALMYSPPGRCLTTMDEAVWRTVFLNRHPTKELEPLPDESREIFEDLVRDIPESSLVNISHQGADHHSTKSPLKPTWENYLEKKISNKSAFVTHLGWIGIGEKDLRPGDIVVILFGSDAPVVLRADGDNYKLIGHCYVHGIMKGEFLQERLFPVDDLSREGLEGQIFNIC